MYIVYAGRTYNRRDTTMLLERYVMLATASNSIILNQEKNVYGYLFCRFYP